LDKKCGKNKELRHRLSDSLESHSALESIKNIRLGQVVDLPLTALLSRFGVGAIAIQAAKQDSIVQLW